MDVKRWKRVKNLSLTLVKKQINKHEELHNELVIGLIPKCVINDWLKPGD